MVSFVIGALWRFRWFKATFGGFGSSRIALRGQISMRGKSLGTCPNAHCLCLAKEQLLTINCRKVMLFDADPAFLREVTGGDVPMSEREGVEKGVKVR